MPASSQGTIRIDKSVVEQSDFKGVYWIKGRKDKRSLATKNIVRGFRVHGEKLFSTPVGMSGGASGGEYREWDPWRSKLAAAIMKGLKQMPVKQGSRVLYLGAANGVTASFVSDVVGEKGSVYCVEISPQAVRDLIMVCEKRGNMLPLLADARNPESYAGEISGGIDVVYEDVSAPEQAEILIENSRKFLKRGGWAMIAVKARCIDAVREPEEIYGEVEEQLKQELEVVEKIDVAPFEKDHLFIVLRRK
jgi:fibrillarin-like pre-rRNA processing protein